MEAKEKAIELVYKYYNTMNPNAPDCNISFNQAKQCALIAVNEVLGYMGADRGTEFWQEVKSEINKL